MTKPSLCAVMIFIGLAACSSREPATETSEESRSDSAAASSEHQDEHPDRVTLSEAAYLTAEIRVDTVREEHVGLSESLEVPGQVEFDPRRVSVIASRVPGRIERLMLAAGDQARRGQVIALLYSPAYISAQADFLQARRRAALLVDTDDESGATAIADAARRRLTLIGASGATITRLEHGQTTEEHLGLEAPFDGTIMEVKVLSGETVEAGEEVLRLADLSVVDVVADVPEPSLPFVRVGQPATIEIAAFPGLQFAGAVERLHGELNPETRTVHAVIHATNTARRLRPGMFATVRLAVAAQSAKALTIAESAILTDGEQRYVFVQTGLRQFDRRFVEIRSLAPPGSVIPVTDRVAVSSGLQAGERVVVTGAFTLKSELTKAALGEHAH